MKTARSLPASCNATMVTLLGALVVSGFVALYPVLGFSATSIQSNQRLSSTRLFAEGGPPQYQKQEGILRRSECVGKGSYLLYIDSSGDKKACEYEPGHVLALEILASANGAATGSDTNDSSLSSRLTTMNEKTQKDAEANDGWLRGPYTVSRGYGSTKENNTRNNGFQVLVKEVGYKSHVFATCPEGTPVRFGGKFKVPIVEGILEASKSDSEEHGVTKRVVLVASGVGVGPCVGACEELMASSSSDNEIASIDLLASFRTQDEVSMLSDLNALQDEQDSKIRFGWKPVITEEAGRLSANGPDDLVNQFLRPKEGSADDASAIRNTHYHIIGNGLLVNEWTAGLKKAGVPDTRVTTEAYFNHMGEADPAAIDTICEAVLRLDLDCTTVETESTLERATQ